MTRTPSPALIIPRLARFVPGEHPWTWGGYVLYQDYDGYSAKLMQENVVQLQVRFEQSERVEWVFDYERFFQ